MHPQLALPPSPSAPRGRSSAGDLIGLLVRLVVLFCLLAPTLAPAAT
ncbi:MAG: hypothetical protein JNM92_13405, partial [Zoogloea sp.]|nr:hypothetical protein [Zoogloea sp.]